MKLWILKNLHNRWYDTQNEIVVRAEDEEQARKIADENHGYEGNDWDSDDYGDGWQIPSNGFWLDPTKASCEQLTEDGEAGVIVRDYRES